MPITFVTREDLELIERNIQAVRDEFCEAIFEINKSLLGETIAKKRKKRLVNKREKRKRKNV